MKQRFKILILSVCFLSIPAPAFSISGCGCDHNAYNCADFPSLTDAQFCFGYCINQGFGDIHRMDLNNDGLVCTDADFALVRPVVESDVVPDVVPIQPAINQDDALIQPATDPVTIKIVTPEPVSFQSPVIDGASSGNSRSRISSTAMLGFIAFLSSLVFRRRRKRRRRRTTIIIED